MEKSIDKLTPSIGIFECVQNLTLIPKVESHVNVQRKSGYFSIPSILQSGVVKSADTLPLQLCLCEVLGTPLVRICYSVP